MGQKGEETKEVVHVKAKKYDGFTSPEIKRFSIDPSITNYRMLRELLTKGFHIAKGDFVISYLMPKRHSSDEDRFLPMLCDWDLQAAIYGASQHQLVIKVDMKPFEEGLEEWDVIAPDDLARAEEQEKKEMKAASSAAAIAGMVKQISFFGNSSKKVKQSPVSATRPALSDAEFRSLLDSEGRLLSPQRLRLLVYQGGVEPSLRPVVWRHLLNIYPKGLTGNQRIAYTKTLAEKYQCLKESWQRKLRSGRSTDDLRVVANAVRKDVIRTDRAHPYYSGEEERNENILALFNILTTFALSHPDVAYCQGMSDLASPLLVVMRDEAQAYICFCALMSRVKGNFMCDGRVMTRKFQHLSDLLQFYDPVFYEYLREMHAEDLLFCYRWLLLELKREFTFDDALLVLETMWASLPPENPEECLPLFEVDLTVCEDIPFSPTLRLPTSNRALKMLDLATEQSSTLRPDTPDSSETETDSTVDSESKQEDSSKDAPERDLNTDPAQSDSTGTLQAHNEVPLCFSMGNGTLSNVHSCPGNLSGLCHAAVVRSLLLGKSSESQLHSCHPNLSYPPKLHALESGVTHCQRTSRRLHSESCSDVEGRLWKQPGFYLESSVSVERSNAPFSPVIEEDPGCTTFQFDDIDELDDKWPESLKEAPEWSTSLPSLREKDAKTEEELSPTAIARHGSFGSCATPRSPWSFISEERRIKASAEHSVADDSTTKTEECGKKEDLNSSPVPVASEATIVVEEEGEDPRELTLTDIYDICVAQVAVVNAQQLSPPSSLNRSRQTSGEATARGNPSPREPLSSGVGTGGSKSRHASSNQAGATGGGDSGYSGATTPYTHSVDFIQKDGGMTTSLMTSSSAPSLSGEAKKIPGSGVEIVNIEKDKKFILPPPEEFGDGNPFMMFVCLTLLMEHRDRIIKRGMDFNEIAIYFDKLARKHSAFKILKRARYFYADYLKSEWFLISEDMS